MGTEVELRLAFLSGRRAADDVLRVDPLHQNPSIVSSCVNAWPFCGHEGLEVRGSCSKNRILSAPGSVVALAIAYGTARRVRLFSRVSSGLRR